MNLVVNTKGMKIKIHTLDFPKSNVYNITVGTHNDGSAKRVRNKSI